jgi:hypothetical protein
MQNTGLAPPWLYGTPMILKRMQRALLIEKSGL